MQDTLQTICSCHGKLMCFPQHKYQRSWLQDLSLCQDLPSGRVLRDSWGNYLVFVSLWSPQAGGFYRHPSYCSQGGFLMTSTSCALLHPEPEYKLLPVPVLVFFPLLILWLLSLPFTTPYRFCLLL